MTARPKPLQRCAACGCTDANACVDQRGACHWVSAELCSHCAQPDWRRAIALVAAHQAIDAAAELLRFAREGDHGHEAFGDDVAERLADATRASLIITEGDDKDDTVAPLREAITDFLEGWA